MPHGYDDSAPWNWVFLKAVDEFQFWYTEFESKAVLIKAETERLGDWLGLETSSSATIVEPKARHVKPPPTKAPKPPPSGGGGKGSGQLLAIEDGRSRTPSVRSHQVSDGKYTHNRSGLELCTNYNKGACHETVKRDGLPICAASGRAHQCCFCLGQHPAEPTNGPKCSSNTTDKPPATWKGSGKGKKGRGRKNR